MRILIDTTFARRGAHSGTAVYITQIVAALRELGAGGAATAAGPEPRGAENGRLVADGVARDVTILTAANPRRRPPAGGGLGSVGNALADLIWTERELPRIAARVRADVIHHPLPARCHTTRIPQVITVHDLAFARLPGAFATGYRVHAQLSHRHAARTAAAIIAPSQTTADDAHELWGIDRRAITIAPHGPGQAVSAAGGPLPPAEEAGEAPASPPKHFLYVGDEEPRKDLDTLRAAHARSGTTLPLITAHGIPTGELLHLYAGAAALIQPSRYEGFGLTALEAMALGTPVIAARAPGLTETCAAAALYFTPGDAAELARHLSELATDSAARARLSDAGRARAAAYSWRRAAEAHLAAYSLAVARCA